MKENYKKTKLGWIPKDWEVMMIEDIADVCTGNKDTQNKVENGKYPFFVRSNTIERINSFSFEGEAVLTSGDGVGVGKIYHYLNEKFDYHQRVYNIHHFKKNILGKFFFFYFSNHFYARVNRLSAKNSVDSVRRSMITEMLVPLPPLTEQKKIAKVLSTIDSKIQNIQDQIAATQDLKKGLMQQLLTEGIGHSEFKDSKLGRIPKSWEVVKLGKMVNPNRPIRYGIVQTGKNIENGIACLRVVDFSSSKLNKSLMIKTSEKISNSYATTVLQKGDIVFCLRGRIGDVRLINEKITGGNLTRGVALISNSNKIDSEYLLWQIRSNSVRNKIMLEVNGTTLKEIPIGGLKKVLIPLAPLNEQKQIANILSQVDKKITNLTAQGAAQEELKRGLMQVLLTGEVRIRN